MKLNKEFYLQPAIKVTEKFLGKYLVYNSPKGKISGMISEVEAYPAFIDNVSHGNKKTKRTEVMYREGGFVYVYLIYGLHHQFAVVVNKKDVPEVVFIRSLIPKEGVEIMKQNFNRLIKKPSDLTKSPGNLCRSLGIDLSFYGEDLTKDKLFLEDRGLVIPIGQIIKTSRAGINKKLGGSDLKLRYYLNEN